MKKLALAAILALGLGGLAFAQGGDCQHEGYGKGQHKYMEGKEDMGKKGMHHRKGGLFKVFKELDLTKEQRTKIKEIMKSKREAMKKLREEKRGNREPLNFAAFMDKDKFNADAFKKELDKQHAKRVEKNMEIRTKRVEMMADSFKKIFEILTPEQREKLLQLPKK
jgi:protein CpxP